MSAIFMPSRAAGLERLAAFVPHAGADYADGRNTDPGPDQPGAVSRLSPWLRYRLISEGEVVDAVLARHTLGAAEKYVQEVLWRTYWKGWLEMRPGVWSCFVAERDRQRENWVYPKGLAEAEQGRTGIEGFDDWAQELVETGYLHNHARMWFASIWIFTLKLPWALGADFFLRHLIDADAASNTLSWRWVAGLQTVGKTYLATTENIARYTGGRFAPKGLALHAEPLTEPPVPAPVPLSEPERGVLGEPALLLVTPEDLNPDQSVWRSSDIRGVLVTSDPHLLWGDQARAFVSAAAQDCATLLQAERGVPVTMAARMDAATLAAAAEAAGVRQIVTPYAPIGPVADALAGLKLQLGKGGVDLIEARRRWDETFWPHARKGFFPFKQQMPRLLEELGLTRG
ncbi:FAD-binding domain-containing protein [Blastomonas sp. AAP53]|uniref:FAD-binding domain-containing protein n=1 Tax=Blastomonas sp. AAP53 TaxID=1248760 RepID=UPI001EE675DD|nr:FAD-binding domain-containing protein [Blastomonas sp. AAP53]